MNVEAYNLYLLHNEGNNKQKVFFENDNYHHFLRLFKKYVAPYCEVLCWSLIPSEYYFLVYINDQGAIKVKSGNIELSKFANGVRLLQSTYAKQINKLYARTGSLFRSKAKAKLCDGIQENFGPIVFDRIHNMPLVSGLVSKRENWAFSSFSDYFVGRNFDICNFSLTKNLLGIVSSVSPKKAFMIFKADFDTTYSRIQSNYNNNKFDTLNHILLNRFSFRALKESG